MGREIKFRAWFVESGTMYSWEDLINKIGLSESTFIETELWKPMQFTGLKDKSGVEIYEGDIGIYHGWKVEVRWNGKMCYYYVEFSKQQFGSTYRINLHECYKTIKPYNLDLEVIGNIYENKELLK